MAYLRAAENSIHRSFFNSIPGDIRYMFAYGSGVFKQSGHSDKKAKMLDYIVVVDQPQSWHEKNLSLNRNHYSFLKHGGGKFLTEIQRGFGAGVYFNTLVPFQGRLVKYGVIATEDLENDLLNWSTLYISGRMHKPILAVHDTEDESFHGTVKENLESALATSIILLPDTFTDEELFLTIANLSYGGDFRMIVGEDKNKVRNLVLPHIDKFHDVYRKVLKGSNVLHCSPDLKTFQHDSSPAAKHKLLSSLPLNLRERVIRERLRGNRNKDTQVILHDLAHSADCSKIVSKACRDIVSHSSWWQSLKGIFTAGVRKSVKYSASKVKKMVAGGRKA